MSAAVVRPGGSPSGASSSSSFGRPGETARQRLDRVRATLRTIVVAQAALWGVAAAAAVVALGAFVRRAAVADEGVMWTLAAMVAAVVAGAVAYWRAAPHGVSRERAALWVEARVPALRYALVTLADARLAVPDATARSLDAVVRDARWDDALRRSARRALLPPALLAAAMVALTIAAPTVRASRLVTGATVAGTTGARRVPIDRLARVRATITPPPYSGLAGSAVTNPSSIEALVGSTVTLAGDGAAEGLRAVVAADSGPAVTLDARPVSPNGRDAVDADDAQWRVTLTLGARPASLRLEDGGRTRLLVLVPRLDAVPHLTLAAPLRDTVLRQPTGVIPLRAVLDDDLGLAAGAFEYILSSGEGETFTFKSTRFGAVAFNGARHGELRGALDVVALGLKPGDIVHVRAVATDRNPVLGRGGSSDTRTIRVARADEYDSVAVDAIPPSPADTAALSQRMLLMLTEALAKRAPKLSAATVAAESRKIAADQARLRQRVSDIVFMRFGQNEEAGGEHAHFAGDGHNHANGEQLPQLTPDQLLEAASRATDANAAGLAEAEGGDAPIVAISKPLLEAYNHMWDAGRALGIAEPAKAIEPMRRAIAAMQRARAAERLYLRGKPPAVVIDLAKVRLAARVNADTLHPAARTPRPPLDARTRERLASIARAVDLVTHDPGAAADTLALLRVGALGDAPALAAALGETVDALRGGRDATAAFVRARRLAAGTAARSGALGAWTW